jgi:L-alanine-DL-glutamate epimerase-like enolase superfamily enzyme
MITEMRCIALRLPVSHPTRISTRVLDARDYLLVTLRTDTSEQVGLGYAYVGTRGAQVAAQLTAGLLQPVVVGFNEDDRVGAWARMYQETLLAGRRGLALRAISAVDIALWDLAAKQADVPLAVLLGGGVTEPVRAYASGGYYKPGPRSWADSVTREITQNREDGFVDHKIKVGGLSIAEDAARVAAAAAALGQHDRLALDANNAYRTEADALRALRAFQDALGDDRLWWFEEPLSPDNVAGHARLREHTTTPIATGEIAASRWDFQSLIERRAADILQPDAGVLGGITEYLRVAHAAEVFDHPIAPHWHANLHVHLAAATTNCLSVEHFRLDKDIYNFEQLLTPECRLVPERGALRIPDKAGLGIELDEKAVKRFSVSSM